MSVDLARLRQAINHGRIEWRKHTLQRLAERHILQKDVLQVLLLGEMIRDYANDQPFSSVLMLGWVANRPLHAVASYDEVGDMAYIITI